MIVWSGWGIVVLLLGALGGAGGTGLAVTLGDRTDTANYGTAVGLLLAGVAIWYVGQALNRPKPGFSPRTGQPVLHRNQHTFFFVPAQFWGPLAAIGAVVVLILRITA